LTVPSHKSESVSAFGSLDFGTDSDANTDADVLWSSGIFRKWSDAADMI
jgi:hypothetical protein